MKGMKLVGTPSSLAVTRILSTGALGALFQWSSAMLQ
jgi:hypothetical protein